VQELTVPVNGTDARIEARSETAQQLVAAQVESARGWEISVGSQNAVLPNLNLILALTLILTLTLTLALSSNANKELRVIATTLVSDVEFHTRCRAGHSPGAGPRPWPASSTQCHVPQPSGPPA
jgi:hypothetical protein